MNRIKELRRRARLTQEQLAERCGTTGNTISRLELGEQELTQAWMVRLAQHLGCSPADLIANVILAEVDGVDVEPATQDPAVAAAILTRGLHIYRVIGRSVIQTGLAPGDTITVDQSENALARMKTGEIVLVEVGPKGKRNLVLRQFLAPTLLTTNRLGTNMAINLDDPTVEPRIVGVVIPAA